MAQRNPDSIRRAKPALRNASKPLAPLRTFAQRTVGDASSLKVTTTATASLPWGAVHWIADAIAPASVDGTNRPTVTSTNEVTTTATVDRPNDQTLVEVSRWPSTWPRSYTVLGLLFIGFIEPDRWMTSGS